MRVTKVLPRETAKLIRFFQLLNGALKFRGSDLEEMDDEDRELFEKFCSVDEDYTDGRLKFDFHGFVEYTARKMGGGVGRICFGYDTLVDNCCDPDLDYLDFNAEIKAGKEAQKKLAALIKASEEAHLQKCTNEAAENIVSRNAKK